MLSQVSHSGSTLEKIVLDDLSFSLNALAVA